MLTVIVVRGKKVGRNREQVQDSGERKNIRCETVCTLLGRECQVAGWMKVYTIHTMCVWWQAWAVYICIYICINYLILGMQICALVQQQGTCLGAALRRCIMKCRRPILQ